MNRQKRIGAVALCMVFALAMLVSSAYMIHEAGHDCAGEECPICRTIALNSRLLRLLGALIFISALLGVILCTAHVQHNHEKTAVSTPGTLVSLKIRLNN